MTNREAINALRNMAIPEESALYEPVEMAVRALGAEYNLNRTLDRIKAEIRELATADTVDTLVDVVKIMNKYRTGGEE